MSTGKPIRASKKRRGRPKTTGKGILVGMRWHHPDLDAIDAWRKEQPGIPTRSDAIRQLVRLGIASTKGKTRK